MFRCGRQTVLPEYHLARERVFDFDQKETSLPLSGQLNKPLPLADLPAGFHRVLQQVLQDDAHVKGVIGPRIRVVELRLEADAQIKAPPPGIVDDHIGDRVSRLERQLKVAHALVHFGNIVVQAGVFTALGQALDVGQMPPHFMFHAADTGIKLLRLVDARPDRLCLLVLNVVGGPLLFQRRHALLKDHCQIGPSVKQQGQHR